MARTTLRAQTSPWGVRITPVRPGRPGSCVSTVKNGSDERLFGRRLADFFTGRDPRGGNVATTINPQVQEAVAFLRRLAEEDWGDREQAGEP